jgi:hypothetical protein
LGQELLIVLVKTNQIKTPNTVLSMTYFLRFLSDDEPEDDDLERDLERELELDDLLNLFLPRIPPRFPAPLPEPETIPLPRPRPRPRCGKENCPGSSGLIGLPVIIPGIAPGISFV